MARSTYLSIDAKKGEVYRTARRDAGAENHVTSDLYVTKIGAGATSVADPACRRLAGDLRDLMEDIKDQDLTAPAQTSAFMQAASDLCFERLRVLPGDVLSSQGFWRLLALDYLYEVIDWRYPNDSGERWGNSGNFVRNLPLSLYIRGQICSGLSPADKDVVAKVNDIDVWTSHVAAVAYGSAPKLVVEYMRTIGGWQDPKTGNFPKLRREQLRELASALTAARSNIVYELVDSARCRQIVDDCLPGAEAAGMVRALESAKNRASKTPKRK